MRVIISNNKQKDNPLNCALDVNRLTVFDKDQPLLKSISLQVSHDAFHCIIGESGSGKSLLTRAILNIKHPYLTYQGDVHIDLNKTDAVFQDVHSNMFQYLTIEQHFKYLFQAAQSTLSLNQRFDEVLYTMERLGFSKGSQLLHYYRFELSGGMAQRIAFVMSLVSHPKYLILDEPTSALDKNNIDKFMSCLMEAKERYHTTIIFVTHDLRLVKNYASHISIMKDGEILESGDARTILNVPTQDYTKALIQNARRREKDA